MLQSNIIYLKFRFKNLDYQLILNALMRLDHILFKGEINIKNLPTVIRMRHSKIRIDVPMRDIFFLQFSFTNYELLRKAPTKTLIFKAFNF